MKLGDCNIQFDAQINGTNWVTMIVYKVLGFLQGTASFVQALINPDDPLHPVATNSMADIRNRCGRFTVWANGESKSKTAEVAEYMKKYLGFEGELATYGKRKKKNLRIAVYRKKREPRVEVNLDDLPSFTDVIADHR